MKTNKRTTKRALLLSILSMFMCVAMLMGTTYAWFTDSVTSKNNVIKSGNLDIELDYFDGKEWKTVEGSSEILDAEALWEPGYTDVVYLRLKNAGTLALKYNLGVNIVNETAGVNAAGETFLLSDYIYFDVADVNGETNAYKTREEAMAIATENTKISAGYTKADTLMAGNEIYLAMVIYMPTTVGNKANHNGKDIPQIDLGINVMATQVEAESDSFGNDYDAMAAVDTEDELKTALTEKSVKILLGSDIVLTEGIVIAADQEVAIDLSGHTISHSNECTASYNMIGNDGTLTIEDSVGNGKISFVDTGAGDPNVGWASYTIRNNGTLTVNGGTVEHLGTQTYNGNNAIFHYAGTVTVNGGVISAPYSRSLRVWKGEATVNGGSFNGQLWVQPVDNNGCSLTINGGSFKPATYGGDSSSVYVTNDTYPATVSITGGNFATKIGMRVALDCVTGGTFSEFGVLNYVADGADITIKLNKDLEVATDAIYATIPSTVNVKLDMAGHKIDVTLGNQNDGVNAATAFIKVENGASLVVDGDGEIFMTPNKTLNYSSTILWNQGNLTINSGDFEVMSGTSYAGGYIIPSIIENNAANTRNCSPTLTINGGTFTFDRNMIRNFPERLGGMTTITINGGTFTASDDEAAIWNQWGTQTGEIAPQFLDKHQITINGGIFNNVVIDDDFKGVAGANQVIVADGVNVTVQ